MAHKKVIKAHEEKGYIRQLSKAEAQQKKCWYLPHFAIVRPQKTTTKVRIVFDAAANCGGLSLNDAIFPGPKLQRDLFVLMRFRKSPVAIGCDVTEMYLQIALAPEDRPYHRFSWHHNAQSEVRYYEFNCLVFGVNASPFLAQYVTQQTARDQAALLPRAAEAILTSTYTDDTMDSVDTPGDGQQLHGDLKRLWNEACMTPRKWVSNSTAVLEPISADDQATQIDLSASELTSVKTLGVCWNAQDDVFTFNHQPPDIDNRAITKRYLLSKVVTVFDPLGFLSPFVVRAKMLRVLQECWPAGSGWDEPLPDDIQAKARLWFAEVAELSNVKVQRYLIASAASVVFHTFCDASTTAYGAFIYACSVQSYGTATCRFIASKSRVAPTKAVGIPRLELMAAVLGVQLAQKASQIMAVDISQGTFWADRATVLHWLRGYNRKFKPFVANRVSFVQDQTALQQWRHVPTADISADLASHGSGVVDLADSSSWWQGPQFLHRDSSMWLPKIVREPSNSTVEECKSPPVEARVFVTNEIPELLPRQFSDWTRLVMTRAWVHRFIVNCRNKERTGGELTSDEIEAAGHSIIREAQQEAFHDDIKIIRSGQSLPPKSRLAKLSPRIDSSGMIRSDGRTQLAEWLPFDKRFPIIVPGKHPGL